MIGSSHRRWSHATQQGRREKKCTDRIPRRLARMHAGSVDALVGWSVVRGACDEKRRVKPTNRESLLRHDVTNALHNTGLIRV